MAKIHLSRLTNGNLRVFNLICVLWVGLKSNFSPEIYICVISDIKFSDQTILIPGYQLFGFATPLKPMLPAVAQGLGVHLTLYSI